MIWSEPAQRLLDAIFPQEEQSRNPNSVHAMLAFTDAVEQEAHAEDRETVQIEQVGRVIRKHFEATIQ